MADTATAARARKKTEKSATRQAELPQPEPGLTPEVLVERARAMIPLLREQQDEADWRGHYSDEVHEGFRKAGFYRILQPRLFGGYQFQPSVFLKVIMEIARGHPASAWCYALAASHGYVVASHLPEAVQRKLFGPDGEFISPMVVMGNYKIERVEGGYRINGTWPFCSGAPVSNYIMAGGVCAEPDGKIRNFYFATPRDTVTILPDWGQDRYMGMQASGSNSIKLENVFVPEEMTGDLTMMIASDENGGGTPGTALHGDPMYLCIMGGWFNSEFASILTGTARAALDEFLVTVAPKQAFGSPGLRSEDPFIQQTYGTAMGKADSAERLTLAAADLYESQCRRWAETGQPIGPEDTMTVWGLASEAAKLACEAVEMLFHAAGASQARRGAKLQRYFRDIEMYRLHPQSNATFPSVRGKYAMGHKVQFLHQSFDPKPKV